jgi:glycine/serine hydroxymethyltransferase
MAEREYYCGNCFLQSSSINSIPHSANFKDIECCGHSVEFDFSKDKRILRKLFDLRTKWQTLIDLRNKNISGKKAEQALVLADITANKNMVPFDDKSAFVTSGVRFGVPAITSRGLVESDMQFVVDSIDKVLMNADNAAVIADVKSEVNEFMSSFKLYPEL